MCARTEPGSKGAKSAKTARQSRGLRSGQLRFFRTIAQSVGVQGPTGAVVIAAAVLAGVSGGGTALVELVAAVAMGFVAYAFIIFTRGFNSAGSVYGFTGAVVGARFGFLSAWALMLVYVTFAGGICAAVASEASAAVGYFGPALPWQTYALTAYVLVMALAFLEIKVSAGIILGLEGVSMLLVVVVCAVIVAKGGNHGNVLGPEPFQPNGVPLSVLGLGVVLTFSSFSGFEAATTLGEETQSPQKLIPWAIGLSLAVVAAFTIVATAIVTNAFPSTEALASDPVPLVTLTNSYVADWVGELVSIGATISAFGAALACVVGASRILFAVGRDTGPTMLTTTTRAGAPAVALIGVAAGSLVTLLLVLHEDLATQAVAVSLGYGADLIIAAYILVVVAAIIFNVRRRVSWISTAILVVGLAALGYVVKVTFIPLPPSPFRIDALAAAGTLVVGILLPIVFPAVRRGIRDSALLKAGAEALLPRDPRP